MLIEEVRPTIMRLKKALRKAKKILYYFHDCRAMIKEEHFYDLDMQKKMKKKCKELLKAKEDIEKEANLILEEVDEEIKWLNSHIKD